MPFVIENQQVVPSSALFQPNDSLIDGFIAPDGSFQSATCQDATQQIQIGFQRHIDLRTFQQNDIAAPTTMFDLDLLSMGVLDLYTMAELDGGIYIAVSGEHWTSGTVGPQADRSNQLGIQLACGTGETDTHSITLPIDILTGFGDNDFISLACPAFPASDITLASSFLDLTSDPGGSFTSSTVSVALSTSTIAPVTGDSELRFFRHQFNGIDLSAVTGVRLRIVATTPCTFRCMAIRLIPATWANASVDLDTRRKGVKLPVTRNGSVPILANRDFPTSTTPPSDETDFPILFRTLPGTSSPIDIKHTTFIYTGSMSTGNNWVDVLYRCTSATSVTMFDLDGTSMRDLDGLPQPDFSSSSSLLVPETVSGLDGVAMASMDGRTMAQMDSHPTTSEEDYLKVRLLWAPSGGSRLEITGKSGGGYEFAPTLQPDTYYVMFTELVDVGIRCRIYESDPVGNIDFSTAVLDTTTIIDPSIIHLRRGRIGWYAHFADGDSLLLGIDARYTNFGEYTSNVFNSQTPVQGARIFTQTTGDRNLADTLYNGLFGGTVVSQPGRYAIQNVGSVSDGGAQTAPFWVYDWENLVIEFDLLFPSSGMNHPLEVFLINEDHIILPLVLPSYNPDHWQHYRLQPIVSPALPYRDQAPITGYFSLQFLQAGFNTTTWYLRNLNVTGRSFRWRMRSDGPDLWNDDGVDWTYFDVMEDVYDGAVASNRGTSLQVSGVQMNPAAQISSLQIVPRYASPGRLIWSDQGLANCQSDNTISNGPLFYDEYTGSMGNNHIARSDPDGSNQSRIATAGTVTTPVGSILGVWQDLHASPDGTRILALEEYGQISSGGSFFYSTPSIWWVMNIDGSNRVRVGTGAPVGTLFTKSSFFHESDYAGTDYGTFGGCWWDNTTVVLPSQSPTDSSRKGWQVANADGTGTPVFVDLGPTSDGGTSYDYGDVFGPFMIAHPDGMHLVYCAVNAANVDGIKWAHLDGTSSAWLFSDLTGSQNLTVAGIFDDGMRYFINDTNNFDWYVKSVDLSVNEHIRDILASGPDQQIGGSPSALAPDNTGFASSTNLPVSTAFWRTDYLPGVLDPPVVNYPDLIGSTNYPWDGSFALTWARAVSKSCGPTAAFTTTQVN
jgi:hypothetical protein